MLTAELESDGISSFEAAKTTPRVNLGRLFHLIHEHGFKRLKPDLLNFNGGLFGIFGHRAPTPTEAVDIYHQGKPERYALTAEIVHRVIDRAIAQRPQRGKYGLIGQPFNPFVFKEVGGKATPVEHIGLPDPFGVLSIYMLRTLKNAWAEEMQDLEQMAEIDPDYKVSRTYLRPRKWEEFYDKYLPKTEKGGVDLGYEGDHGFTFNYVFTKGITGIGSAAGIMPGFLRVIPEVCEANLPNDQIDPDLLADVAKNSFPAIARMGMMHFDIQPSVLEMISKKWCPPTDVSEYLSPDYFRIIKGPNGISVDFVESIWQEVEAFMVGIKSSKQRFVLGCPAMAKVDGVSAMQKLWDWQVDIAKVIYKEFWSTFFEPAFVKQSRLELLRSSADAKGVMVAGIHF